MVIFLGLVSLKITDVFLLISIRNNYIKELNFYVDQTDLHGMKFLWFTSGNAIATFLKLPRMSF